MSKSWKSLHLAWCAEASFDEKMGHDVDQYANVLLNPCFLNNHILHNHVEVKFGLLLGFRNLINNVDEHFAHHIREYNTFKEERVLIEMCQTLYKWTSSHRNYGILWT